MSGVAVAIVGGGRVGLTLARALAAAGHPVQVLSRTSRALPPPLHHTTTDWPLALGDAGVVILAVPDDQVAPVAATLLATGVIGAGHTVLHLSGLLGRRALAVLDGTGAALGSLHPLQTFRDDDGTLVAVPAILEGDPTARAAAHDLAEQIGMSPMLEIGAGGKAEYHAAAVFAANYLVVLSAVAERLGREAGLATSWRLFLPLMRRTLEHLEQHDPAASLTGPIRRGDVGTVRAHLAALAPADRALYAALGREALRLAEPALDAGVIRDLRQALDGA